MPNRIEKIRESQKLSQRKLAEMVGTSGQQIGFLEKGERQLDQEWMERLGAALGVHPAEVAWEPNCLFALSDDERRVLEAYRSADNDSRRLTHRALSIPDPAINPVGDGLSLGQHGSGDQRRA